MIAIYKATMQVLELMPPCVNPCFCPHTATFHLVCWFSKSTECTFYT